MVSVNDEYASNIPQNHKIAHRNIGICQIVLSALLVILEIVKLTSLEGQLTAAVGIWVAPLVIVSGAFGVALWSSQSCTLCILFTSMFASIFGAILSVVASALLIYIAIMNGGMESSETASKIGIGCSSVQIIVALGVALLCIIQGGYSCCDLCCLPGMGRGRRGGATRGGVNAQQQQNPQTLTCIVPTVHGDVQHQLQPTSYTGISYPQTNQIAPPNSYPQHLQAPLDYSPSHQLPPSYEDVLAEKFAQDNV